MNAQPIARWSRREFLGGVALAGTAGFLGLPPRLVGAEPPPETATLKLSGRRGGGVTCQAAM